MKTYLDFAENDYQFLCASREAQIHGNAICVLCHAACERYLKHILDYYSKDAIHLEVFRTSSLNALLKLLKKYVPEFDVDRSTVLLADGFQFSSAYPGINSFFVDSQDEERCYHALEYCRAAVLQYCSENVPVDEVLSVCRDINSLKLD